MTDSSTGDGRRGTGHGIAAVVVVLVVIGSLLLLLGLRGTSGPPEPQSGPMLGTPTATTSTTSQGASGASAGPKPSEPTAASGEPTQPAAAPQPDAQPAFGQSLGASPPVGIEIPSIQVKATSFVDLGLASDGTITVPGSAGEVGFYAPGPTPGELGPAVLAAHVDSKQGPGIFYRLGSVKAGDQVIIHRQDGTTTTFAVDKVASYPKDHFPTDEVYHGSFTQSEIRLVTCGGPFDTIKHYLDNVIVFGHLTSTS